MSGFLVAYAVTLLVAVLVSALARRTVLSTAVLFLLAGFVVGGGGTGVVPLTSDSPAVGQLAELALFAVLFTDGMRIGWPDLRRAWRLPGRALGWGLPLTLLGTALLARYVAGLDWSEALLIGAVLAPTDPVFAVALVGNERVPGRLRHLLNVESGVNDGLALPFVVVLLAVAADSEDLRLGELGLELASGIAIGLVVPWVAIRLLRSRFFAAAGPYEALAPLSIALLVFALANATHGNLYLAAFAAGVTVATVGQQEREAFEEFGELVAELLKLAALLVFGALLAPAFLAEVPWTGWLFALLALLVARPAALAVSFLRSGLSRREQAAAMWFGPKGFASVVYGLLVAGSGIAAADEIFHLVAITIALSILLHSSTDVLVARSFDSPRRPRPGRTEPTRLRRRNPPPSGRVPGPVGAGGAADGQRGSIGGMRRYARQGPVYDALSLERPLYRRPTGAAAGPARPASRLDGDRRRLQTGLNLPRLVDAVGATGG